MNCAARLGGAFACAARFDGYKVRGAVLAMISRFVLVKQKEAPGTHLQRTPGASQIRKALDTRAFHGILLHPYCCQIM
jgi:hypothetical protein